MAFAVGLSLCQVSGFHVEALHFQAYVNFYCSDRVDKERIALSFSFSLWPQCWCCFPRVQIGPEKSATCVHRLWTYMCTHRETDMQNSTRSHFSGTVRPNYWLSNRSLISHAHGRVSRDSIFIFTTGVKINLFCPLCAIVNCAPANTPVFKCIHSLTRTPEMLMSLFLPCFTLCSSPALNLLANPTTDHNFFFLFASCVTFQTHNGAM